MTISIAVLAMTLLLGGAALAQEEKRLGLVIGNSEYAGGTLATSANDAGLVAQTLQAAGFDVMGARDLDGDALRNTFRDFVDKVSAEGPGSVVVVYLAGHGVQYEGENYFVPVDAKIERDVDVPIRALRISDYVRPLGALNAKAVIVVLDAAREAPFAKAGQPLAGGLALVEPAAGMLWAFNAAPGTIAMAGSPPYGAYAKALAEMMREGGQRVEQVLDRVRLRVHDQTSGGEVPWHAGQLKTPIVFFERAADAPVLVSVTTTEERRARPIQAFDDAREAYLAALERDTLQGYLDFLRAYPDHALAKRVRAIVAARREAITWRRTRNADTPEAYWSYLDRYPNGPHAYDARRRLAFLTAPPEPPPRYTMYEYDLPPPMPEEIIYIRRPYVYFADPVYAFVAPPPPPVYFLPPPPPVIYFAAPPPPVAVFVLPVPVFVPMPIYVRHPVYVRPPPPTNVVFRNIHAQPPVMQPGGVPPATPQPQASPPQRPAGGVPVGAVAVGAGVAAGAAAAAVALPPSVQKRATTVPVAPGATGASPVSPAALPVGKTGPQPPGTAPVTPPVRPLPGVGSPLPGSPPAPPVGKTGPQPPGTAAVTPPIRPLPGTGSPLPPVPGKSPGVPDQQGQPGAPKGVPVQQGQPGAPKGVPVQQSQPSTPQGGPPTRVPGQPQPQSQPTAKSVAGTPPPGSPPTSVPVTGQPRPSPIGRPPTGQTPGTQPPAAQPGPAPATPRQTRIDRAQDDRAAVQQKLQADRQRDLERRRGEQDAQARARQQNQLQDLQRQRQQQMDAQRQQMQQQRAQQMQQQQQQMRQQQMQQQQQQAAQAAARAQAEAAARARAQQQQQKRPPCGGQGQPPCPR